MDSLTQVVLGSTVAALAAPVSHRRLAIIIGAILGTLPDLDTIWFTLAGSDAITTVTWHRGPSHSLFVLAIFGYLIWVILKQAIPAIKKQPRPWFWAIEFALLTHPLLDAFTVYGTQLFWPLQTPPVMWSSIFIIDPLYTLPLLAGVIVAWFQKPQDLQHVAGQHKELVVHKWLAAGLIISSLYLAWSVTAKYMVNQIATRSLLSLGLENSPRFSAPLPLNTLLWRVIVIAPDGYYIGDYSLVADHGPIQFVFYPDNKEELEKLPQSAEIKRLLWFTHGFISAHLQKQQEGGSEQLSLIVSDLRMGLQPDYFFQYEVAKLDDHGKLIAVSPITRINGSVNANLAILSWVWRRIWNSQAVLQEPQ